MSRESELYAKLFAMPNYSPDDEEIYRYQYARAQMIRHQPRHVLDVGSGRGTLLRVAMEELDSSVMLQSVDLGKFHNYDVPHLCVNLERYYDRAVLANQRADMACCLDTLEHISEDSVPAVLKSLTWVAPRLVVSVPNHSDVWLGAELHLVQQPEAWWREQLTRYYEILDFVEFPPPVWAYTLSPKKIP